MGASKLIPILFAGACSFEPLGAVDPSVDAATPSIDAPRPPTDVSVTIDAPPPPPPQVTCTTSDGQLKLCIEFEDEVLGTALDGSGLQHNATVVNATAATRDVPDSSRAIRVASSTTIMIPDTNDLDSQKLTISAWVQRSSAPSNGQRFGVVDVGNRQAALAIDSQGRVQCFVKTVDTIFVGTGGTTGVNEWALVACTYDEPNLCMYTFRNGSANPTRTCGLTNGDPLDTSEPSGSTIGALFDEANNPGSRFAGNIDSVRIYGRALSESELCTAGGLSGC